MDVLDPIYNQLFFTTNSLGCQPTTSQYFQSLTPQTLALAAAGIHSALSEFASGKKATVMFSQDEYWGTFCPSHVINITPSQDEYWGTFCPSHVINITPEATALIHNTLVSCLIPPLRCNSARIGTPQSSSALLSLDGPSSISFRTWFHTVCTHQFPPVHLGLDCRCYIEFHTPYPTPHSPFGAPPLVWALLNPSWHSSA